VRKKINPHLTAIVYNLFEEARIFFREGFAMQIMTYLLIFLFLSCCSTPSQDVIGEPSAEVLKEARQNALDWLSRHQHPDGYWDADDFGLCCAEDEEACTGKGQALNDVGVTGLALLAFLNEGHTVSSGRYKGVMKRGTKFLCNAQAVCDDGGCFVPRESMHWVYNHAIATLAVVEAYDKSKWPILKKYSQLGIDCIHRFKNPGKGWRYGIEGTDPTEQNDTSVTGWMVLCLASARKYGLNVNEQDLEDALGYIAAMTDPETGRTGYMKTGSTSAREAGDENIWPCEKTEALTALAMLCRCSAAEAIDDEQAVRSIKAGAALLDAKPPEWNPESGSIDYCYWYFGSRAMKRVAGKEWQRWRLRLVNAIVDNQIGEGCAKGSWDPQKDPWGDNGGRVYSTALLALSLGVF